MYLQNNLIEIYFYFSLCQSAGSLRRLSDMKSKPGVRVYVPALRQDAELNSTYSFYSRFLRSYILRPDLLISLGYPVECSEYPGRAIIYKDPATFMQFQRRPTRRRWNVNAKHFVPMSAHQPTGTPSYCSDDARLPCASTGIEGDVPAVNMVTM
jgi:hypothetical protein